MAYQFHPVATHFSSSSDKAYTVCVREDTRIADPNERKQAAILTCNCPGWTRRCPDGTDASRTCKHVKAEAHKLAQFKSGTAKPAATTARQPLSEMPKVTTRAGALEL